MYNHGLRLASFCFLLVYIIINTRSCWYRRRRRDSSQQPANNVDIKKLAYRV
ncbi:hypothetical protein P167DRAFT_69268 [Morchella conica CCBAS932]|uniref:Uncharacterized protein n=1 Tax=Morchella conica CCBAS932 TaxID=1392247 RepID=A0A3N4KYB0_9PEZI|nr:hypothetical protein P167DRAFT_69268 [Morchella conica CCBAS932]